MKTMFVHCIPPCELLGAPFEQAARQDGRRKIHVFFLNARVRFLFRRKPFGHFREIRKSVHPPDVTDSIRERFSGSIGRRSGDARDIRNKQLTGSRVHENTRFLRPVWRLLCARHRPSKKNFPTLIRRKKRFHTRSNSWFACVLSKRYATASTGFFGTVRSSRPWAPGWIR